MRFIVGCCLALLISLTPAHAGQAHIAVAANFTATLNALVKQFEAGSEHRILISSGSTGKLYAQIKNGAPFDILLAADSERPQLLEQEKLAVPGSRFTYAAGRLVLWSLQAALVDQQGAALTQMRFKHLAIANPKTAPYGVAAREALEKMGLWQQVQPRLVQGEDIGQTFQFVASGNAELGLVALAQAKSAQQGAYWVVPPAYYQPIAQQAVLLEKARDNAAARDFLAFLKTPAAGLIIERFGYARIPLKI